MQNEIRRRPLLTESEADNLLGLAVGKNLLGLAVGKKAKAKVAAKKQVRQENKKENRSIRVDRRKARVEGKRAKNQSRLILAEQGIDQKSGVGEAVGALLGAVTGVKPQPQQYEDTSALPPVYRGGGENTTSPPVRVETIPDEELKESPLMASKDENGESYYKDKKKSSSNIFIYLGIALLLFIIFKRK